ncbi:MULTISPECIES: hypothetical protein [unclassified Oceanispirochaeta]|uniref:hypothetical protein n=1 Tax=unclassified Oceanispirochaeta TaxID=2635722 RepID=UPI000E0962DA|nr:MULTISPECIES: hypothetical protein [unclassified Oceanispirochaeta]MBF9018805.1 hypothetical protein [Oceanispirochaeta sp. M2]NPD75274.1 hypothetical protein [Oceanispirochaeta sp. M1]RDG28865.1 hypothetical protein DV872_24585 [Oceanispirochaeta sp. M1]
MDDNDWSLSASFPVNVRQRGINASLWANIDDEDRDGNERTDLRTGPDNGPDNIDAAGWSMGAYEED